MVRWSFLAIIKSRQSRPEGGFGWWRLMPPGYGGRRLRARDGTFRASARVTFFCCQKKVTKENHLDLRFKDPLARCGSCRFGGMHSRMKCGGGRCRFGGSLVPLAPLPLTLCEGRIGCAEGVGDYQIAPIAARSTAMGRWRLMPPGYGGRRLRAGRGVLRRCAATPHPPPSGTPSPQGEG